MEVKKFGVMSLLTKSIGMSGARKEALLDALGIGIYFIPRNSRAEVDFIDELEDILSERNLHGYRQYPVLNYRIDYYLPEYKLAIEEFLGVHDIIKISDIVKLKKPHPCGSREWEILRVGADFRLKCVGCGHQIMIARKLVEKNTRGLRKKE